ncbi:hypothetical protein SS50377_25281 [Spironucleus salmonicida]|uniref:Uncharacterized protein n=1 Tax=Spironucleus salmonicida TaxID=348837 RepID=V6LC79_9EUKA|nr:hypothetical protein SS50377_25281 [Spironucleus salmonicida]|eukprot:EST41838.1 Hypothetical protein SS50377_18672 [Spironucleus salmonicida]
MNETSLKAVVINNPKESVICAVLNEDYLFFALENDFRIHQQVLKANLPPLNLPQVTGNVISLILRKKYILITTQSQILIFNLVNSQTTMLIFFRDIGIIPVSTSIHSTQSMDIVAVFGLNLQNSYTIFFGVDPELQKEITKFQQFKLQSTLSHSAFLASATEKDGNFTVLILYASQKQYIQGLEIDIIIDSVSRQNTGQSTLTYKTSVQVRKFNEIAFQFSGDAKSGLCMSKPKSSIFTDWGKPDSDSLVVLEVNQIIRFYKVVQDSICIITENCDFYMLKLDEFNQESQKIKTREYQTELKHLKDLSYEVRRLKGRFLDCQINTEGEIVLVLTQDKK